MAVATAVRMAGSNPRPGVCVKIYGFRPRPATALALAVVTSALFACGGKRPPRPRPAGSRAQAAPSAPFPIEPGDPGGGHLKAKLVSRGGPRRPRGRAVGDPGSAALRG